MARVNGILLGMNFVSEKVHEGRSIMGLYPPTESQTKQDFEVWRKAKGR